VAVTEQGRIVLCRHFEETMGEEKAKVLMDHLLPAGWTDLATKQDLRELRLELTAESPGCGPRCTAPSARTRWRSWA
jgi:hypothetical protein